MNSIEISTETIKLSQLLKLADLVQDGVEAKHRIQNGEVRVNGETETRRGRKLRAGDRVEYGGSVVRVDSPVTHAGGEGP